MDLDKGLVIKEGVGVEMKEASTLDWVLHFATRIVQSIGVVSELYSSTVPWGCAHYADHLLLTGYPRMSFANVRHNPTKCFVLSANTFWEHLRPPNCPCVLLGGIPSQSPTPDVWIDTSECAVWDLCRKIIICLSRKGKLIIRKDPSIITQLGSVSLYILLPGKDVLVSLEPLLEEGTAISDCPLHSHLFACPWWMDDPLGVGRWSQIIIIKKGRRSYRLPLGGHILHILILRMWLSLPTVLWLLFACESLYRTWVSDPFPHEEVRSEESGFWRGWPNPGSIFPHLFC